MSARDWQILPGSLDDAQEHSRAGWLLPGSVALAIVALGAAITASFALSVEQAARTLTRSTLEERATHIEHAIVERLNGCKAVLQAGAGYIDNAWPISEEQWRRFVRPLSVSLVSSGVQGFGFAAVVDKLASWQIEAIPAELWRDATNPGDHPQTAILYLEPQDERNQRAIGFDMASEPVRRAAMAFARDRGEAAASAKVTLVQEIDSSPQPGFLMYVPVYQRNMPINTTTQRRQALIGYAYSPFRAVDFLDRVFQGDPADMTLEIYDGPRVSPDALMYRRSGAGRTNAESMFNVRHVTVAGHQWTLRVTATSRMVQNSRHVPLWIVWSVGTLGTLLLGGLAFAMTRSRQVLRERLLAEERLLEKERDAATILENSLEAFIVIDEQDEILEWNKQAVQTFGWTKAEVLGRKLADVIVPERLRVAHMHAIEGFHTRQHTVLGKRVEMPAIRRDGEEIIVALSIAHAVRRGQSVFFASMRDVTARKQQQEEVKRLNATLEQRVSERTEELETANRRLEVAYRDLEAFTRSVSHDLRAPLRAIKGYATLLAQGLGNSLTPQIQRDMEAIASTTQRMEAIVDNLLKLASVSQRELHTQELMLGDLVGQVVAEISPPPEVRVHILLQAVCVQADPGLLTLALRNLISNAVKFSQTRSAPEIWIGVKEIGHEATYYVRDNGVGFDARYGARLFGAFQRLHSEREFEGTGLGLTIVKSVIEKHGGRVWAESSVGAGATFYFILPRSLGCVARKSS